MQTSLLVTVFFSAVAAQIPFPGGLPPIPGGIPIPGGPIPGIPDVDCFNVLGQVCSDADTDLCKQCTNGLSFILNRAGCTDADYEEYCNDGLKCEDALRDQFKCTAKGVTAEQCYECAQQNQQALLALQCNQAILVSECESLPSKGNGGSDCLPMMKNLCGDLQSQGDFCFQCIENNVNPLTNAGCDYNQTSTFCEGSAPDMGCEKALEYACGDQFQMGTECFHCLADKQDIIRKAGCQNDQLSGFCTPKAPPKPPTVTPQGCMAMMSAQCPDTSNQVTCLRCVSSDFESLMRVGCTKEEVIGYCS